ncbi:MAG: hypothetical protein U0V74_02370 [Chitinophagales bacterium]
MKFLFPIAIVIFISLLPACKPMPNDGVPFYLKIDSVQLNTNAATQGANTHNITDVWVEANATNLGAYELPCNFPVLEENNVNFTLSAGIEQSGQAGIRVIYPFYQIDTFSLNAVRTQTYTHLPVFRYKTGTEFAFVDDFETSNNFTNMPLELRTVDTASNNVAYGQRCGVLTVSATDSNELAYQSTPIDLPEGEEIWVEVDYKSEVPFWFGYVGYFNGSSSNSTNPFLFINAKNKWSKLYIKLSESLATIRADKYSIYFEALRPYGTNGGKVYIDNVKIVHILL